jgi:3-oxoadipate enol-lactonase
VLQSVDVYGTLLNVYVAGTGPAILFIHGFPLDHQMWQAQLDEFQQGYQVIAPDLRGFGSSQGTESVVTMLQYAEDLITMLDELNVTEPVTICGLSMGGYIAWQLALAFPERISRLVLCDTRAQGDDKAGQKKRLDVAEKVMAEGPEFLAQDMPEKLFAATTFTAAPEVIEQTQTIIRNTTPQAIAAASLGMARRPDVRSQLGEIAIPTLVVCGTDDAIVPVAEMQELAAALPQAEFVEIPAAGHMAPLEQPQTFNHHLRRFLGATDI